MKPKPSKFQCRLSLSNKASTTSQSSKESRSRLAKSKSWRRTQRAHGLRKEWNGPKTESLASNPVKKSFSVREHLMACSICLRSSSQPIQDEAKVVLTEQVDLEQVDLAEEVREQEVREEAGQELADRVVDKVVDRVKAGLRRLAAELLRAKLLVETGLLLKHKLRETRQLRPEIPLPPMELPEVTELQVVAVSDPRTPTRHRAPELVTKLPATWPEEAAGFEVGVDGG